MKEIIAIDPGATGALAKCDFAGRVFVENLADTLTDLYEQIQEHDAVGMAYLENVGFHVKGNNASASCKFARHCGALEMALVAAKIPQTPVTPQKWMKAVCGALPKEKAERKRVIRDRMQRMYPSVKVTLQNADALGLLTYAIWQEKQG